MPFPEGDAPTEKETAALKAFATDRLGPIIAFHLINDGQITTSRS